MRKICILMMLCLMTGHLIADDSGLIDQLFRQDELNMEISASGLSAAGSPSFNARATGENLNPGKVLMLSAIIPGAGQFSIGSKWRAMMFFGMEIAAWYGVVTYYNDGQDKDKEFKIYADAHFTEQLYRNHEWFLATRPEFGNSGIYEGNRETWEGEIEWQDKLDYLPSGGFTHELPSESDRNNSSDDQQYYEMIGKYIGQFGFGWDSHPDDFPFDKDDKPYFDGQRIYSEIYMDMW